ncbi:MAG: hypothetical protein CVU79_02220 [Elusimicrobia bacterium HGW-Elusimicrobia-3]|jgi:methionine biosynthesis protein MetW|nr:MAG: hypothetical protein CVU79_02220 [Elusimicrobia bacterium HGW-Elusimicrobia-3]
MPRIIKEFFNRLLAFPSRVRTTLTAIFTSPAQTIERMDYNEYWEQKLEFGFSDRYPSFSELIEDGSTVLDIGCGNGATLKYLTEHNHIIGEGIDISAAAVNKALERGFSAKVADAASSDFKIEKVYDYIIISEVLEHIPNPEDLIEKVKNRFRRGLLLSIPNTGHYTHRLRLLFGRFPVQWVYHPGEHLRFWTLTDFKLWLSARGYKVASMKATSGLSPLCNFWPEMFADSIVFLVKAS